MIEPIDSLEIAVIVDNVTDNLSSNPKYVETEVAGAGIRGVNNLPTAVGFFDYEPDTVTAYDVGSKNRFLDDRLQAQVWSK
jgi:hypothetical protein